MYADTASMIENPLYRYTIRDANGVVLRKGMSYERFAAVRPQYKGRQFPVRVIVSHLERSDVAMYDLSLSRWFWSN